MTDELPDPSSAAPDALPDDVARRGIAEAAQRLRATIGDDRLDLPVASCPGWSLERLVGHTGRVHRWVTGKLLDPASAVRRSDDVADQPPAGTDIGPWFDVGVAALLDALASADLEAECDTWAGRRPTRFWLRRMLQETTLHAWDAEATVGAPSTIPLAIALDGIDEVLEMILPYRFDLEAFGASGETIHLHATDDELGEGFAPGAGEWLLTIRPDGLELARTHAKGDVAVRGPAASLLLLTWGRTTVTDDAALTVFGDAGVLERLARAATL